MMRCHDCRTLLLDLAYGLLDAAEAEAVQSHLAECPACKAASLEAGRAQGLFAQAAKVTFPNLTFVAPPEDVVIPFSKPRKARSHWVQWAVAASVLAMIPGTLIPVNKLAERYESARRDTDDAATRTANAKTAYEVNRLDAAPTAQLAAAEQKHLSVVSSWVNDAKAEATRKVSVNVTKPQSVVPGAPNEYVIAVVDPSESLNGSRVEAQFRDQAGQVLHTQPVLPKAETPVRLPAEVWNRVTPQSELVLSVSAVNAASGARTELLDPIRLYGPIYATMLVTDKAAYRPGEQIHFRSLTLDRITLRPPTREQNLRYTLRKTDGSGETLELTGSTNLVKDANGNLVPLTDAVGKPIRGVGCGSFLLPANLAEGEYTLTLTELSGTGGAPPAMTFPVARSIRVRAGGPEKFTKKLTFTAPSYMEGQPVEAIADLKLGDKPVVGAKGTILLKSDQTDGPFIIRPVPQAKGPDGNLLGLTGLTDETGRFRIPFAMPAGTDVQLTITFDEKGGTESVVERVPVTGKEATIEFFPEGGKLLGGVPNRVYVRGTGTNGKPIDVRGTIVLGNEIITRVDAPGPDDGPGVHRGVGSFTFTPKADAKYQLRLMSANPAAAMAGFDLPKVDADGVSFTALDTVVKPGQPIRVRVHSVGKDRKLVVGAYTRGRLADKQSVLVKADAPSVVTLLGQADTRGGVTRITVFEEVPGSDLVPVAERLVFRKPGEVLNLTATPTVNDRAVDLAVVATDEKGNPVPAILWVAAVNAAVAPDSKHRALPTHFLLSGEVQTPDDLEYADFLLTDHAKAAESLDHVLATQGWRRFVEQKHTAVAGTPAEALLKMNGKHQAKSVGTPLAEKYWPQFELTAAEVDAARNRKDAAEPVNLKLYADYESSRRTTEDAAIAVNNAAGPYDQIRDRLTLATGGIALLCVMLGMLAWARGYGMSGAMPYFVGMIAAAGLSVYFTLDSSRNPATVPPVIFDKVEAPKPSEPVKVPDVKLPVQPKNVESGSGEKFLLSAIGSFVFDRPQTLSPLNMGPALPARIVSMPFRTAPGQTVLDAILAAEAQAKLKSEAFAKEQALGTLRKLESALIGSGTAADAAADRLRNSTPLARPLVVREYAAPRPVSDDVDTIMWKPIIVLPADGRANLPFQLGTAPGGYQVLVAGHSPDGRLGSTKLLIPTK